MRRWLAVLGVIVLAALVARGATSIWHDGLVYPWW